MRIFWKQLLLHLGTLVICFTLLALVLTQGIRSFLTEQKVAELTTLAGRVATAMEGFEEFGIFNLAVLNNEIVNIHQYTDATIMIVNNEFAPVFYIGFDGAVGAQIYVEELMPIMYGEPVAVYGIYAHPSLASLLIVGYPFWFDNQVAGAALVGFSMQELENAIADMVRIAALGLLVAGLFAFVLIYISSQAISRPLRQLNEAAGIIASGDFEKRLQIRGRLFSKKPSRNELGQLAHSFNTMAQSLQEQEKIRREFIANLSHDMRSPLTSMHGFLTAISDGTISKEAAPRYLGIVMSETERLIKLSNNILDTHSIRDGNVELELAAFDINELIRSTILGFWQRAVEKRIIITSHFAHASDIVIADEDKIRRVIHNLIDNALKFTDADGQITVETTANASRDKVTISVADTGRGMTDEEQKRAFDRFYKGDSTRNEDKMGSGLGLSIVKDFVRAHGSIITVESKLGNGTVFAFELPVDI